MRPVNLLLKIPYNISLYHPTSLSFSRFYWLPTCALENRVNALPAFSVRTLHTNGNANIASGAERSNAKKTALSASELSWNEFFAIKKKLAWRQRYAGIPLGISSFFATSYVSTSYILSNYQAGDLIWGIDPLFYGAFASIIGGALGYFGGAALSQTFWRLFNKERAHLYDGKVKNFCERIVTYRMDANYQPLTGALPDYYGEKIFSVQDYRRWLHKQREQTKKAQFHLGNTGAPNERSWVLTQRLGEHNQQK